MIVEAEKDWTLRAKTMGRPSRLVGRLVEWSAGPVFFGLNIDTPNRWEDLYKREAIARDILYPFEHYCLTMQPTAKASAD